MERHYSIGQASRAGPEKAVLGQQQNRFADWLDTQTPAPPATPSRSSGGKHIGGSFDPAGARQIKSLAVEEDTTVQELVAAALGMPFESRGKPIIARLS